MMERFFILFLLFLPVILGGILNMIFVKIPFLNFLKKPMDFSKKAKDGKRIFGDNKTWKGFLGMILGTILSALLMSFLGSQFPFLQEKSIISFEQRQFFLEGFLLGLGYALAELPNSFIKRRINIAPGKNISGLKGLFFGFIDQVDSVIGSSLALMLILPLSWSDFLILIFMGAGIHYMINIGLYLVGLKKQAA